ncbi:hypothetical protein AAMO2058_000878800 [Amorphochlora amoebiformis]|mmetsp:Transcript_23091/g.36282  ORF Transcript_23091/g.36282 Transcript_23091/m.36282 type:complete len:316 (-) Transcript_23091:271-1218(-)
MISNREAKKRAKEPWDVRLTHNPPHDVRYYQLCAVGGILSCGITHTSITPIDVTKCKMPIYPTYVGMFSGMRLIAQEEGALALMKGWAPTAIGYSLLGLGRFGLYEIFKDIYSNIAGKDRYETYKGGIYLAASASAEFFADILLCPWEMVKIKMQISEHGTYPTTFGAAMAETGKINGFPFGSLVPLWTRQIPYTMAKFYFFERIVELFYLKVFTHPRKSYSRSTQLGITFASGYAAGVICAIVSQPADNLVSQMGKPSNQGKSFAAIAREQGVYGLFFNGLGPRVLMIGTLTGFQWWIYDTWKTAMGMGTSGGH